MCVVTCVCIYMYGCRCVCACVCVYIRVYLCRPISAYVHTFMYVCVYIYIYASTHVNMHAHIYMYCGIYVRVCIIFFNNTHCKFPLRFIETINYYIETTLLVLRLLVIVLYSTDCCDMMRHMLRCSQFIAQIIWEHFATHK